MSADRQSATPIARRASRRKGKMFKGTFVMLPLHKQVSHLNQLRETSIISSILQNVDRKLNDIVGMEDLKKEVTKFAQNACLNKVRQQEGHQTTLKRPNFLFIGNPGTGKTSIAVIIAGILHECGLVDSNKLVSVQRQDLVSDHIGGTEKRTKKVIDDARGGTLLIDEAYQLVPQGKGSDFGHQALNCIMAEMEGDEQTTTNRPAFIFAGYPGEMDKVINFNRGFSRRITMKLNFPDYTVEELVEILLRKAQNEQYVVEADRKELENLIKARITTKVLKQHNAGFSTRLYTTAKQESARRICNSVLYGDRNDDICLESILMVDFAQAISSLKEIM